MKPRHLEPAVVIRTSSGRGSTTRLDAQINDRLDALGIELQWPASVVVGGASGILLLLGARMGGVVGFVGACVGCVAVGVTIDRFADRRRLQRADKRLPEITLRLGRALRSGLPLEAAIAEVSREAGTGHVSIETLNAQLHRGRPISNAIDAWVGGARSDAEQLFASAVAIGFQHGGDLAAAIDGVGNGIRDDLQLDERRIALLTQTRLSAAVLVTIPIAFAAIASLLQGGLIYQGGIGLLLVVSGLALDGLGVLWMCRLMRELR
jgi:Flp pilus assembly protein TadB